MDKFEKQELAELKKSLGAPLTVITLTRVDQRAKAYAPIIKQILSDYGYSYYNAYRKDDNTVEIYGCDLYHVSSWFQLGNV